LKEKTYAVFEFSSPLKVGIAPLFLSVSEKIFEKKTLYEDLAQYLHRRKIKAIEFQKGLSTLELNIFITKVTLPSIDLIKGGGLSSILKSEGVANMSVEELDYYSLLRSGGIVDDESKDVWAYLLNKAVKENNQKAVEELSENFGGILQKINSDDLSQNDDLLKAMNNFFEYLSRENSPKLGECSKESLKMVLRSKTLTSEKNVERIKEIVKHLSENDACGVLLDELLANENFDVQSMQLFSMLIGEKHHENIAISLKEKINRDPRVDAKNIRRIKDLFSGITNPLVSAIYRQALSAVIEKAAGEQGVVLDRSRLYRNYRFMLLNLFELENTENEFNQIADKIMNESARAISDKDAEFIECLVKVLEGKKHSLSGQEQLAQGLHNQIANFLEEKLLSDANDIRSFDIFLQKTTLNKDFYFDRIFSENGLNTNTLRLFLKFFSKETDNLCKRIRESQSNPVFLKRIVDDLKSIDTPDASTLLIFIFQFANQFLKAEILKIMQNLSYADEDFLVSVLSKEDIFLRKQALVLLAKNNSSCVKALKALLLINNFLGFNNKIIEENINIVAECGIKEASDYLTKFSKIKVFWKNDLKNAAIRALARWYDRKN
jgi:hypothetical protein